MRIPRHARQLAQTVRLALWAHREVLRLKRSELSDHGLHATVLPPPPSPDITGRRAMQLALPTRRATCLQRSLVLRAFLDARGVPRAIVIGVKRGSGDTFQAHAWVEGIDDASGEGYAVIRRLESQL